MIEDNRYRLYDNIIAYTIRHIYNNNIIKYNNIDLNNYNDLYILTISDMAANLLGKDVYIHTKLRNYYTLFWKERKIFHKRKARLLRMDDAIDRQEIIDAIKEEFSVDEKIFEEIYNEYYARDTVGKNLD